MVNKQGDVMKKQLAIALGLAVVSVPAMASKARLESLGQGANGSQYIDDHRSIFLNAASLNQHKDFVTIEVGNTTSQTPGASNQDSDTTTTPKAEGGVFKASGNMVYGIYFGEEANSANSLRAAAGLGNADDMEQNSTTLFVAGDAGVQWGASLLTQSFKDEANDRESSAMRARLGVISGDIEAFANIGLTNKAEDGTNEFEGKSSFDIGVTYSMGDIDYMARVQSIAAENAGGDEYKSQVTSIGAAKSYKLNDKAMLWASAFYNMESSESFAGAETKETSLPVTVSLEVSAKEWLDLRGFVGKNVFIGETEADNGDKETVDGLNHGVGASLRFGDLRIDGSLILASAGGQVGVMNIDEPLQRISLTYDF
jgi:hypothetical protein